MVNCRQFQEDDEDEELQQYDDVAVYLYQVSRLVQANEAYTLVDIVGQELTNDDKRQLRNL